MHSYQCVIFVFGYFLFLKRFFLFCTLDQFFFQLGLLINYISIPKLSLWLHVCCFSINSILQFINCQAFVFLQEFYVSGIRHLNNNVRIFIILVLKIQSKINWRISEEQVNKILFLFDQNQFEIFVNKKKCNNFKPYYPKKRQIINKYLLLKKILNNSDKKYNKMSKPNKTNATNTSKQFPFGQKFQLGQSTKQLKPQELQMMGNIKPSKRESNKTSLKQIALGLDVKKIVQRQFDPFRIPPDLGECYFHRKVTQFGKPIQDRLLQYKGLDETQSPTNLKNKDSQSRNADIKVIQKLCPCCGQEPKQQVNVCCRTQEIYNINESLGFYFTYIKTMCFMLFLVTATLGVYALDEVITHCQSQRDCLTVYGIPISKFHVFFTDILMILNVLIILIIYTLMGYLYYINAHIHKKIFLNHKKPSDYCVLISGIDHQKVSGQDILNHFSNYQIIDILYTHQIQNYTKKLSQKSILEAKKNLYYRRGYDQKLQKIQHQIDKVNNYLLHIKNKLTLKQQKQLRTDKIILKFKTPQEKLKFQQNYKENIYQTIFHSFCGGSLIDINQNKMYIEPLGEPHEIVWENFQLKSKQRYFRILIGNIFTVLILSCSYMLVALLTRVEKDFNGTKDIILSLTFSIVIQVTNFVLDVLIQRLTNWQKRYTLTGKIRIILIKNFFSFFLNTTLIPFSLFLFAWGTPDQDDLIRNIFTLFLMSNFVAPFISLYVRPRALYFLYKKRQILKEGKDSLQTQIKANEYFEKLDFDLNARYSVVIQILANAIFYASIFPVGLIITLMGLTLAYWTSKWWLIRYCSIPKFSHRLGRLVVDITALFPCIFSFGYAFNLIMAPGQAQFDIRIPILIAALTIPISLMFILFGNTVAEKFVAKQYKSLQNLYNIEEKIQEEGNMRRKVADYRQLNPTTYIHSDVHSHIKRTEFKQGIWDHLESYARDKQASYLRRDSNLSSDLSDKNEKGDNNN